MRILASNRRPIFLSTAASLFVSGAICALALAGCAGDKPPTFGEQIASVGETHAQLADQWNAGSKMKNKAENDVRAAKKAIKKAQKDLEQAQEKLEDASNRVVESRSALANAEAEARARGITPAPLPTKN